MTGFSAIVKVMQTAMDKVSVKIFRDFMELENLQNSHKSSLGFALKTVERVSEDLNYILTKSRAEYGILIDGKDDFNLQRKAQYNWIVTPICGFNNLCRSVPYFCTSIGLEKIKENGEREVVAGLLENTITKQTFIAEKGKGAFVSGRRIRVSGRAELDEYSVIALNFSRDFKQANEEKVSKILNKVKNIKINDCVSLDIAFIASGKYDGGLICNPNNYETAVGLLLIKEAGGHIKEFIGETRSADDNAYPILEGLAISGNDILLKKLSEMI
jgi:myo-inositol-1(or 4)-monophosphatase